MKKTICGFILLLTVLQSQSQIINRGRTGPGSSVKEYKEPPPFEFKKQSMVSLSMSDIVLTNFTFRYEFFNKTGRVGFQLPLSLNAGGLPDTNNYRGGGTGRFLSARNRIFQTGLSINYYTSGQDKVSPFVGIGIAAGWFNYWVYTYNIPTNSSTGNPFTFKNEKMTGNNMSFAFHGGFLFNPWETLTFTIKGGVGLRRYSTIFTEYTYPYGLIDLSAGFKF